MTQPARRGQWGSRLGFIMAASGSAIGLGNIWRFPYATGANGGGAFVFIYLVCTLVLGLTVMWAELAVGRATQRNPVGAFRVLAPGSPWVLIGYLGLVTGAGILSYYGVVAGWTLGYLVFGLTGRLSESDPGTIFNTFVSDWQQQVL